MHSREHDITLGRNRPDLKRKDFTGPDLGREFVGVCLLPAHRDEGALCDREFMAFPDQHEGAFAMRSQEIGLFLGRHRNAHGVQAFELISRLDGFDLGLRERIQSDIFPV